jgi:hypothetical protein
MNSKRVCESVPRLPAWAVRAVLDDPRDVPYLLLWMNQATIKEAVRLWPQLPAPNWVHLKRANGTCQVIPTIRACLPRNGGTALLLSCTSCHRARRYLYDSSVCSQQLGPSSWKCRTCAGLRYRLERTCIPPSLGGTGGYPRTPPWDPYVFSSPKLAVELGFVQVSGEERRELTWGHPGNQVPIRTLPTSPKIRIAGLVRIHRREGLSS